MRFSRYIQMLLRGNNDFISTDCRTSPRRSSQPELSLAGWYVNFHARTKCKSMFKYKERQVSFDIELHVVKIMSRSVHTRVAPHVGCCIVRAHAWRAVARIKLYRQNFLINLGKTISDKNSDRDTDIFLESFIGNIKYSSPFSLLLSFLSFCKLKIYARINRKF